jgi:hypothetical protein
MYQMLTHVYPYLIHTLQQDKKTVVLLILKTLKPFTGVIFTTLKRLLANKNLLFIKNPAYNGRCICILKVQFSNYQSYEASALAYGR